MTLRSIRNLTLLLGAAFASGCTAVQNPRPPGGIDRGGWQRGGRGAGVVGGSIQRRKTMLHWTPVTWFWRQKRRRRCRKPCIRV